MQHFYIALRFKYIILILILNSDPRFKVKKIYFSELVTHWQTQRSLTVSFKFNII